MGGVTPDILPSYGSRRAPSMRRYRVFTPAAGRLRCLLTGQDLQSRAMVREALTTNARHFVELLDVWSG